MKLKIVLLLANIMWSGDGFAKDNFPVDAFGDQVGNGGKSVVCRNQEHKIVHAQLLDFYEADAMYALKASFIEGSYLDKARHAFTRLSAHDPERLRLYHDLLDQFTANSRFIPSPLMDTPDSDHIVAPPAGCRLEQAAIQIQPSFPNDRLYNINREIWDSFDDENKAGLVMHEIIYFEAIARGHRNSVAVRYLNAHIAANAIRFLNRDEYFKMLKLAKMGAYRWDDPDSNQSWILLDSVEPNWSKAKDACTKIASARLPSIQEIQNNATKLTRSVLFELLQETAFSESWSSTRRLEDGHVAVGVWSAVGIDIFYRHRVNDFANIVCINQ